tara:strand:+ start:134 stop:442 length:309 start_codon:yes stop_codon:yes gene_type:complete
MTVRISGVDLSANTTANIGQAGSSGGTYTVHILNRGSTSAFVQLGVGDSSATFANATKLLENTQIAPDESLSFSPIVAGASDYIIGRSTAASVNMTLMGHDE